MGQINIIVGPPCAGKSTFVRDTRDPSDAVVDYDAIAQALGASSSHNAEGDIRILAFRVRQAAIDSIVDKGIGSDSWIIHTNPPEDAMQRYEKAGAKFMMLDPGVDACLERAKNEGRPDESIDAITGWYSSPPTMPEGSETIIGSYKKTIAMTVISRLSSGSHSDAIRKSYRTEKNDRGDRSK